MAVVTSQAAVDALLALAEARPRAYLSRGPRGGDTLLRQLYAAAAATGLAPADAPDDIARLHSLFDVALDHGMGSLVCEYIAEVCSDRLLTSSDPVEAFLLDGECVRRWAAQKLAAARGRLTTWFARGMASLGSGGVVAKERARLHLLQLAFRALAAPPPGAAQAGAAAPRPPPAELPEAAEAARLAQAAAAAAWLAAVQHAAPATFDRPCGRYSSEQEWRAVAAKRRDAAGAMGLFLADLLAALARHGVEGLAYPAPSTDRLLAALFLAGDASRAALRAKLALLAYHLLDGGFLPAQSIATGLGHEFGVPRDTAHAWLLQQLLDASHAAADGSALAAAVALAPRVDGVSLPTKAAMVFQKAMRPDVALRLLRQRTGGAGSAAGAASLSEACCAVGARLGNGLLVEAYIVLRSHLDALADAPPAERRRHARVLVQQLLDWAAEFRLASTVIKLHFEADEEEALVDWLRRAPAGGPLLALYYLMRGRTPEALLAYSRLCPVQPASPEHAQVLELLRAAARMMPLPQRALVVREGGPAALLVADSEAAAAAAEGAGGGTALLARLPELAGEGGGPRLVATGPDAAHAPLVGSIPLLVEEQRQARARQEQDASPAGGERRAAPGAAPAPLQPAAPSPLLFGQPAAQAGAREGNAAPLAPTVAAPVVVEAPVDGMVVGAQEFDAVLGLGGAGKQKRRRPAALVR